MLGVHFALSAERERRLLTAADAGDEDAVAETVEDIEENDWDDRRWHVESDKAWDAIHRCLGDGTLSPNAGPYPLSHAVLGGRSLLDDSYTCYVTADQARDIAAALRAIDEAELRRRYGLIATDYRHNLDAEDFAYTWQNFIDLREFYDRAAEAGRAVIFTAS